MGRNLQRTLMAACGLVLALAVLAYGWALWENAGRREAALAEVTLRDQAADVVLQATTLETSDRGFVLSGDESFLDPYEGAASEVGPAVDRLAATMASLGLASGDLDILRETVEAQRDFTEEVVATRREAGFEPAAALVRGGEGRRLMERIRAETDALRAASLERSVELNERRRTADAISNAAFLAAAAAALLLAVLAFLRQRQGRRSAAILADVMKHSPAGLAFLGPDLRLSRINDSLAALVAAENGGPVVEGDELGKLFPGHADRAGRLAREAMENRPQLNAEFVMNDGGGDSGSERLLIASFYPLAEAGERDRAAGRKAGIVVIDATARHHAQKRLKRSESRFRTLIDAAAAIVWSTSRDGGFAEPQPAWERFTGQAFEAHRGAGWLDAVHPDDRERTGAVWAEALRERTHYAVEHRLRRHDGAWRDMLVRAVPIFSEDGAIREWIGTHTDVTDTKMMAAELDETSLQFKALADNIPQLAWTATPQGEIFWYNKRWFDYTGTTLDQMRGYGWHKVVHIEHVERVVDALRIEFMGGEAWEDVFPLRGADGEHRWFLSQAVPVRDGTGRILRWFGTNTDITAQREVERELAEARDAAENANRAKSQFIANMSHELRTPLTAVIGYSEMMEEELEEIGEKELLSDLGKIKGNARHLLSLINDVLDLSKIEAERMDVYAETFDAASVVREVTETVGSLIEKKNNTLVLDLDDGLGAMHTDQVKLRQCLINLLSNASKFTENGTITLRARRETAEGGDWLLFAIVDSGIGMTEEQVAKLFQRFTQADASTTRKFGGTGLGLAITRAFAEMLGGTIEAASRENEGSTFTVRLPAMLVVPAEDEPEAAAAGAEITPERRRASAGVVLVVDDDPHTRELVERVLSKDGFLVRAAADGAAGLKAAGVLKPDAILLDVTMPKLDGWAVLTRLKADPDLADIPVVMMTSLQEQGLGYALGASDYLVKPVEWTRLKAALDRYRSGPDGYVLAVDDDRDALERTRRLMERENLRVVTAENGAEALERMAEGVPDLVLLDLVMPVMDGFGFLRALREEPRWSAVPVVVLTSKDLTSQERAYLTHDADSVLQKGAVDLRSLARQIRSVAVGAMAPAEVSAASPAPSLETAAS